MSVSRFPPEWGRAEPPSPVDIRRLLDEVMEDLARDLGRPLSLEVDWLPRVTLRPARMREVLRHLLVEAFGEGEGEAPAGPEVGCHLSEGHFRFFIRPLPRQIPVCLARVRELVEQEGGRVWMEGGGEAGATAWFSLPADPVPA